MGFTPGVGKVSDLSDTFLSNPNLDVALIWHQNAERVGLLFDATTGAYSSLGDLCATYADTVA